LKEAKSKGFIARTNVDTRELIWYGHCNCRVNDRRWDE
jgi:hypothetical protein